MSNFSTKSSNRGATLEEAQRVTWLARTPEKDPRGKDAGTGRDTNSELFPDRQQEKVVEDRKRRQREISLPASLRPVQISLQRNHPLNIEGVVEKVTKAPSQAALQSLAIQLLQPRREDAAKEIIKRGITRDASEAAELAGKVITVDVCDRVMAYLGVEAGDSRIQALRSALAMAVEARVTASAPVAPNAVTSSPETRVDVVNSIASALKTNGALTPTNRMGRLTDRVDWSAPLTNIRGVPENAQKSLGAIQRDNQAILERIKARDPEALEKLSVLHLVARNDKGAPDRGQELELLLETIDQHPQVLEDLYKVATATELFGKSKQALGSDDFEKLRREYLVDVIRGAVDASTITQGPGAHCAQASGVMVGLAQNNPAEFVRLTSELAVQGNATTLGGLVLTNTQSNVSTGMEFATGYLGDLRSVRRSAGMVAFLEAVRHLEKGEQSTHTGAFWWEYSQSDRTLTGKDQLALGAGAKIWVDQKTGQPFAEQRAGAVEVTREEYLEALLKAGIPTLVDTQWSHSRAGERADSAHLRHRFVPQGITTFEGTGRSVELDQAGKPVEYVVCRNPIGGYLEKTNTGGSKFVPPGTILGDRNSFWFEVGEGGLCYVRKDVLMQHLEIASVPLADSIDARTSEARSLGDVRGRSIDQRFIYGDSTFEHKDDDTKKKDPGLDQPKKKTQYEDVALSKPFVRTVRKDDGGPAISGPSKRPRRGPQPSDDDLFSSAGSGNLSGEEVWQDGGWVSAPPRAQSAVRDERSTEVDQKLSAPKVETPSDLAYQERKVNPEKAPAMPRQSSFSIASTSTSQGLGSRAWSSGVNGPLRSATVEPEKSFRPLLDPDEV